MKLAEALIIRKELISEISSIENRIYDNLLGQEGEQASENPNHLIQNLEQKSDELRLLIAKINITNSSVKFDDCMTITEAIAKKDYLSKLHSEYLRILSQSSVRQDRYSKSEIKTIRYVDILELKKKIDKIAKEYRQLDMKIQEKNWSVELI